MATRLNLVKNGIFPITKDKFGNPILDKPDTGLSIPGTLQGEGKLAGLPCLFIRTSSCNLRCSFADGALCDTPYCVEKGTKVRLLDGSEKCIEDIQIGDLILGYDTKTGQYVPSEVLNSMSFENKDKRKVSIEDSDGNKLICTENELFYTGRTKKQWREAINTLSNSRFYTIPFKQSYLKGITQEYKTGYIAGLARAEGSFWHSQNVEIFGLEMTNVEATLKFREFLSDAGIEFKSYDNRLTHTTKVPIYTTRVHKKTALKTLKQYMSDPIETNSEHYLIGFISGFYDGNGGMQYAKTKKGIVNHQILFYNKKRKNIEDIKTILHHFNLLELFQEEVKHDDTIILKSNGGYESLQKIFLYLTPQIEYKKLTPLYRKGVHKFTKLKNKIVSKDRDDLTTVYDITTSTENFVANNFLVHNSSWQAEVELWDIDDIISTILENSKGIKYIVISGGEPTSQSKHLGELLKRLKDLGFHTTIETNATIFDESVAANTDLFSMSPKLSTSTPTGEILISQGISEKWTEKHEKLRKNIPVIQKYIDSCNTYYIPEDIEKAKTFVLDKDNFQRRIGKDFQLKFVVTSPQDVEEIKRDFLDHLQGWNPEDILLMPEGLTQEELMKKAEWVAEECLKNGFRLTWRLHAMIYGSAKKGI
jgi:7-carboxy-7-deazaguanine synthase